MRSKGNRKCEPLLPDVLPLQQHFTTEDCERMEKLCGFLQSDTFKECHDTVDPRVYYDACVNSLMSCELARGEGADEGKGCDACAAFAQYSRTCAAKGVVLQWRNDVPQCSTYMIFIFVKKENVIKQTNPRNRCRSMKTLHIIKLIYSCHVVT